MALYERCSIEQSESPRSSFLFGWHQVPTPPCYHYGPPVPNVIEIATKTLLAGSIYIFLRTSAAGTLTLCLCSQLLGVSCIEACLLKLLDTLHSDLGEVRISK